MIGHWVNNISYTAAAYSPVTACMAREVRSAVADDGWILENAEGRTAKFSTSVFVYLSV